jgi:orotidine-5'-phosphate decarboxylase
LTKDGGLIVNASRSIIYASDGADFAADAREEAKVLRNKMNDLLQRFA